MSESSCGLFDQVHILAFNRPDYLALVLEALVPQLSQAPAGISIHAWVDGYVGSRDEACGQKDRRAEVVRILQEELPQARVHRLATNAGVARVFARAERLTLREGRAPYALFFEDDYVLGPEYMRGLEMLMRWGLDHPEVAIVTAHGIVAEHAAELLQDLPEWLPPQPLFVHSLWAFALKRSHLRERSTCMRDYLATMRGIRYRERDEATITALYASMGLPFIHGTSQDYAKHAALLHHERLAVTVPLRLGRYIGRRGEHANDSVFERLGYHRLGEQPLDPRWYSQALAAPLDPALLRWSRLLELLLIRSNDAERQLLAAQQELQHLKSAACSPPPAPTVELPASEPPAPASVPPLEHQHLSNRLHDHLRLLIRRLRASSPRQNPPQ
jgi:hypothetical protein